MERRSRLGGRPAICRQSSSFMASCSLQTSREQISLLMMYMRRKLVKQAWCTHCLTGRWTEYSLVQANFSSRHSAVVFLSPAEARSSVEGVISARTVSSVEGSFTRLGSSVNVSGTSSPRWPLTPRGSQSEGMLSATTSNKAFCPKTSILSTALCSVRRGLWLLSVSVLLWLFRCSTWAGE